MNIRNNMNNEPKRMIFHHPLPVNDDGTSASRKRPWKMLKAFESIGYEVFQVTGYSQERSEAIEVLKNEIKKGKIFDFVYSETSTMPTALADRDHIPRRPLMDFRFFQFAHSKNIPIGLFYRDVHWKFKFYKEKVPLQKRFFALAGYYYDLWAYHRFINHLFVPSIKIMKYVPFMNNLPHTQLPPGCDFNHCDTKQNPSTEKELRTLYVGGIKPPIYNLIPMLKSFRAIHKAQLTLCCRQKEWEEVSEFYKPYLSDNITIVHLSGNDLAPLYCQSDIFIFVFSPETYTQVALPFKIFESIGYGLPIITSSGSTCGEFIEKNHLGWTISSELELSDLLSRLCNDKQDIQAKKQRVIQSRNKHSWEKRAEEVARLLTPTKGNQLT
ncbi:MAG: glycosyltransferase family 4 protein [Synergistales bacterium]|nr:glycosyltransferase family 4 protein [Synergistales bacterium]